MLDRCQEGEVADDADDLLTKVEEVRLEAMEVLRTPKRSATRAKCLFHAVRE